MKHFTLKEFIIAHALIIAAAEIGYSGKYLWYTAESSQTNHGAGIDCNYLFTGLCIPHPHFEKYMPLVRFKEFRRAFKEIHTDITRERTDPWFKFSPAIEEFNNIRRSRLLLSCWISADESMSAWRPRTTKTGGLPNISFVTRKPEPLGTEFKVGACPITGVLRMLKVA